MSRETKPSATGIESGNMRALFWTLMLAHLASAVGSQDSSGTSSTPDPHRHVVRVHGEPWETELTPEARVASLDRVAVGHDSVLSPGKRWRAFVYEPPDEQGGRVCLEEMRTGKRYELLGLPLPYRPLSDLVWLDDHRLAFDRWSQPHYGIHYVVSVQTLRLVLAAPFPDEFFLKKQGEKSDTTGRRR